MKWVLFVLWLDASYHPHISEAAEGLTYTYCKTLEAEYRRHARMTVVSAWCAVLPGSKS